MHAGVFLGRTVARGFASLNRQAVSSVKTYPRRGAMSRPANPYAPREVTVVAGAGRPRSVAGRGVEAVREQWLVEDRWWSEAPLRRHYLEVVLAGGRCVVVYRDLATGRWYEQR